MIVMDSYGWLEFLTNGPRANRYATYFKKIDEIITPSIVVYEVYKKVSRECSEEEALVVLAQMRKTRIAPLDDSLGIAAAELSNRHKLAMADAIVYATAQSHRCDVVTSDPHFEPLDGVVFIK